MSTPQQPNPQQPFGSGPQVYGPGQQPQPIYQPGLATGQPPANAGILDLRFTRFLSLTLISVWWIVALALIGLSAVVGIISGILKMASGSAATGVLYILGAIVGSVVLAVLTRLFLESIAVLFRISDNTSDMARKR